MANSPGASVVVSRYYFFRRDFVSPKWPVEAAAEQRSHHKPAVHYSYSGRKWPLARAQFRSGWKPRRKDSSSRSRPSRCGFNRGRGHWQGGSSCCVAHHDTAETVFGLCFFCMRGQCLSAFYLFSGPVPLSEAKRGNT